jgi:predicted DNA-binding protein (UPF0251 family)
MINVRSKKKKQPARSPRKLTALDDFLKQEGKLEEFEAVAIKEVLAWQLTEAMKAGNMSRKRLAERMKTSRSRSAACSTRATATSPSPPCSARPAWSAGHCGWS